ncbi:MAG TPA: hypothetical protein VHA74_00520 [Candidatus Dojkabacteria bacterium]|nr:hypothetical protein [Candidatus Dojkabacteria bacterium]
MAIGEDKRMIPHKAQSHVESVQTVYPCQFEAEQRELEILGNIFSAIDTPEDQKRIKRNAIIKGGINKGILEFITLFKEFLLPIMNYSN